MCKFCDNLNYENDNELIWNVRSTMATDNINDFLYDMNDYETLEDQCNFSIKSYDINGNVHVSIDYNQVISGSNIGEVIIHPFSEGVQFNYCPMCGKQISKDIKEFTGDGYGIELEENE